jgi:lipoprotein-releasing system permease protein
MLEHAGVPFLVAGGQIAYSLGLKINDPLYNIAVFLPKKGLDPSTALLDPSAAFSQGSISAAGVFSIQQDFDSKYALVPIHFMRTLTGDEKNISGLEIMLTPHTDAQQIKEEISKICGVKFSVKDRYQQHDFLYKILHSEKAAVYLILGFILLIATFNLFGTLTILIIDKRKDIHTLLTMGANSALIRRIFLYEGLLVSVSGAIAGMFIGALCCMAQHYWGFISLEHADGFATVAYPVAMQARDFLMVFGIVFAIGFSAAWYTSRQIVRRQMPEQLL